VLNKSVFSVTKFNSENIYWEYNGKIFNFLKISLKVSTSGIGNNSDYPFSSLNI
jgi:hypothetical protein